VARISKKALSSQCPLLREDIDRFASEISTLRWLRDNTSVNAPELYAWNIPDTHNSTAGYVPSQSRPLNTDTVPWMLMEKLPGVSLTYEMWDDFTDDQRQKVIAT
jgi:serine/threonine protein kinase